MTTLYLPLMTANTAPSPFSVSASSNNVDAFKAFNSNVADSWFPLTSGSSEYLEVDLAVTTQLNQIRVRCPSSATSPISITIQGSSTNYPTFTTIQVFSGLVFSSGVYVDLNITAGTIPYRYYRIVLSGQNGTINVIDSILMQRVSVTTSPPITNVPYAIKSATAVVTAKYGDIALFATPRSFSNYGPLRFLAEGIVKRPVTGQIFPRGFPVSTTNITIVPPVVPNLTNYNGGANGFTLKEIAGINAPPYNSDISAACGTASWRPTGSFCNQFYSNDPDVIWKYTKDSVAEWANTVPGTSTGVLVLDLGAIQLFNAASVFQSFSGNGKVTHLQLFYHGSTSNTSPLSTDLGWISTAPESIIQAGLTGYNGQRTGDLAIVSSPSKLLFPSTSTRYLKLQVRNTGVYNDSSYVDLGGFKLFNV